MGSSDEIIALAKRSGLPYQVGSTYRPGAVTMSGGRSWHASDNAVDFMGANQDALAEYFLRLKTHEVIHHSNRTGRNYATSEGRPFALSGALLQQHRDHLHVAADEAVARKALGSAGAATGFAAGLSVTGGPLAGWIPSPGSVTEALTNVGNAMASAAQSASEVGVLASTLTRAFLPSNLIRGVAFIFGILFLLVGIWFLSREVRDA